MFKGQRRIWLGASLLLLIAGAAIYYTGDQQKLGRGIWHFHHRHA